jgi:hypothetical protein
MTGEAHDYKFPEEFPISFQHTRSSGRILEVAFFWLLIYYFVICPFNILPEDKASMIEYDDGQLKPRIPCFKYFRQYENLHMLFWIAKDLAWNKSFLTFWLVCLVPTILIAGDLLFISITSESKVVFIF